MRSENGSPGATESGMSAVSAEVSHPRDRQIFDTMASAEWRAVRVRQVRLIQSGLTAISSAVIP